ncbi:ferritin-like domain-containing protein [Niallia sp. 03133]|uniref:ferritin-like domain-containing protein n=1 Tax=Niallia sp. 03133 TaxID=3458060 RepID=UPI0040442AB0
MHHYNALFNQRNHIDISLDLVKAINGEYSAIACYEQLEKLAPSQKEKKVIHEIRNDEMKHFHTFSNIYTQLTGKQHRPIITEPCPSIYKAGLDFAFRDEQKTVDFYLDIADKTDNQYIRKSFKRAALDEQNHAVWFLYFLK